MFDQSWTNEQILAYLTPSDEERERLKTIQQDIIGEDGKIMKNPEWLEAREGEIRRFSGSIIGALLGHNKYQSQDKAINELISPTFKGNIATEWGTNHEANARDKFIEWAKQFDENVRVNEYGTFVDEKYPFLSYSPDGEVEINGDRILLEIKCPFKHRNDAQTSEPLYGYSSWPNGGWGAVPVYYWLQMQLGMYIMNLNFGYFVVWTPNNLQVTRVVFAHKYFYETALPQLELIFWKYIQRLKLRHVLKESMAEYDHAKEVPKLVWRPSTSSPVPRLKRNAQKK